MPHWFTAPFLAFLYLFAAWAPILLVLLVIVWWFNRVTPARLVRPKAYIDNFRPPADAPITYGDFTEADVREVAKIEKALFKYTIGNQLHEYLNIPGRFGIVAKTQGRVVGFVLCKKFRSSLQVVQLGVHTNIRRRGIGRILMQQSIAIARAEGKPAVTLWVRRNDTQAFPLYQSMGFVVTASEKLALKMTLTLSAETVAQPTDGEGERQASPS